MLLQNLTGGTKGGLHLTDMTNASRTMLMNIETLKWDQQLCNVFGIPMQILPEIRSSSEIYGYINGITRLVGIPISGVSPIIIQQLLSIISFINMKWRQKSLEICCYSIFKLLYIF